QNPIMMRDSDFGVVRLRAFGTYSIRVVDPGAFMKEVVGTNGCFTTGDIEGQLRSVLVSAFTQLLGKAKIAALDLAANYRAIGDQAREAMDADFQGYGLTLTRFVIENISLPPEVEKMLDTRTQMGIVGDMGRFTQFQTAQAIPEAARSGGAGEFMGMGAGIAMGQQMAGAMAAGLSQTQSARTAAATEAAPSGSPSPAASPGRFCPQCGNATPAGARFCPECGAPQQSACPQCGVPLEASAKFCKECGTRVK
ncbi:MAG: SPFH domain-containing protein, partial [Deltaproteobacteria bacterium]|nr:SPFH domain-containing protein [Deltaproteobacteria bacterium]